MKNAIKPNSIMKNSCFSTALLILLLNSIITLCSSKSILNSATDKHALVSFKTFLISDPNAILSKNCRSHDTPVCNWTGVSCGLKHGRVTALDLSGYNLAGTVSPYLGNLTFLRYLDISSNNFTGFLPPQLSKLRRLKVMNVAENSFAGEISRWLGSLPQLEKLFLHNNNFSGRIPPTLFNNSKLQVLSMRSNLVGGNIPEDIGNASSLEILYLSYNQLSGSVPRGLLDISSMRDIRISDNKLSGVRYLEKAVFNLDYGQLKLVFHALEERKQVIDNAPHLCNALPCMTPCFSWFEVVYYWMGLKMYDLVAGRRLLHLSRYYSAQESIELFPTLTRKENDRSLKGTVVYYDGQMNDSRLNVALACTAALAGAAVLNHAEVISFLKDDDSGRIIGARIRNNLSGNEFDTYAKVIVNAAGPFCDSVRLMGDKEAKQMICPSSGVHVVLPDYYSPEGMGLIVPKTKDGRVVFMLPWLGRTVAGTTDSNTSITMLPEPHEDEIEFILDAISDYLNVKVRRTDVLSAWSGIRPLAVDPRAKSTESISRDHVVCEDLPGLVTITGGKWTTYRSMAEDAVDTAIKSGKLSPASKCMTYNLNLIGADGWEPASFTILAQQYVRMKRSYGGKVVPGIMDTAAAKHLSHAYGAFAERVAAIAQNENLGKRLAHGYPILEAEVAYCARHEYCESAVDFIARRSRLAFLDTDAATRAVPRTIEILAAEHKWDKSRQKQELRKAQEFLETFKSSRNAQFHDGKHK